MKVSVNISLIEDKRKEKGYTFQRMAEMLSYKGEATYHNKAKGDRSFTVEDIGKLSSILNIELKDLILIER